MTIFHHVSLLWYQLDPFTWLKTLIPQPPLITSMGNQIHHASMHSPFNATSQSYAPTIVFPKRIKPHKLIEGRTKLLRFNQCAPSLEPTAYPGCLSFTSWNISLFCWGDISFWAGNTKQFIYDTHHSACWFGAICLLWEAPSHAYIIDIHTIFWCLKCSTL